MATLQNQMAIIVRPTGTGRGFPRPRGSFAALDLDMAP